MNNPKRRYVVTESDDDNTTICVADMIDAAAPRIVCSLQNGVDDAPDREIDEMRRDAQTIADSLEWSDMDVHRVGMAWLAGRDAPALQKPLEPNTAQESLCMDLARYLTSIGAKEIGAVPAAIQAWSSYTESLHAEAA